MGLILRDECERSVKTQASKDVASNLLQKKPLVEHMTER